MREQDEKKASKKSKKDNEKSSKEKQQQDKVVAEFNEKQTKAESAATPVEKIKAWCSKPPYLDLTDEIKVSSHHPSIMQSSTPRVLKNVVL